MVEGNARCVRVSASVTSGVPIVRARADVIPPKPPWHERLAEVDWDKWLKRAVLVAKMGRYLGLWRTRPARLAERPAT